MNKKFVPAYKKFLETWGVDMQSTMAIEEMSELTKAICKLRRCEAIEIERKNKALENIKEEIADVLNMAEQLELFYGEEEIEEIRKQKIERTLKKLKKE